MKFSSLNSTLLVLSLSVISIVIIIAAAGVIIDAADPTVFLCGDNSCIDTDCGNATGKQGECLTVASQSESAVVQCQPSLKKCFHGIFQFSAAQSCDVNAGTGYNISAACGSCFSPMGTTSFNVTCDVANNKVYFAQVSPYFGKFLCDGTSGTKKETTLNSCVTVSEYYHFELKSASLFDCATAQVSIFESGCSQMNSFVEMPFYPRKTCSEKAQITNCPLPDSLTTTGAPTTSTTTSAPPPTTTTTTTIAPTTTSAAAASTTTITGTAGSTTTGSPATTNAGGSTTATTSIAPQQSTTSVSGTTTSSTPPSMSTTSTVTTTKGASTSTTTQQAATSTSTTGAAVSTTQNPTTTSAATPTTSTTAAPTTTTTTTTNAATTTTVAPTSFTAPPNLAAHCSDAQDFVVNGNNVNLKEIPSAFLNNIKDKSSNHFYSVSINGLCGATSPSKSYLPSNCNNQGNSFIQVYTTTNKCTVGSFTSMSQSPYSISQVTLAPGQQRNDFGMVRVIYRNYDLGQVAYVNLTCQGTNSVELISPNPVFYRSTEKDSSNPSKMWDRFDFQFASTAICGASTTTASPPTSTTSSSSNNNNNNNNTGNSPSSASKKKEIIVIASAGGVALILLVGVTCFFLRSGKKNTAAQFDPSFPDDKSLLQDPTPRDHHTEADDVPSSSHYQERSNIEDE